MDEVWTALILTSIAGISTTIGAFLGVINKRPSPRFISFVLAISGGVMVFLSFVEMFIPVWEHTNQGYALLFLGIGLAIGFLFDIILPEEENVHEHIFNGKVVHYEEGNRGHKHIGRRGRGGNKECKQMYCIDEKKFMKLEILSILALFLHNLPEGLATFSATLLDPNLGIEIAVATAMHNIPEGISVALPIYLATKNKKKAVLYAFYVD